MKKLLLAVIACASALALAGPASPQGGVSTYGPTIQPMAPSDWASGAPLTSTTTAPVNISTATTTEIVALSAGKSIYVTYALVIAGGTGNITFVYGSGSSCATGTTSLSGAINLTAQAGFSAGAGNGLILTVPAGKALCITTSAAVQMSGWLTYAQR